MQSHKPIALPVLRTPTGRHEKKRGLPMHAQPSASPTGERAAVTRPALSAAGWTFVAGAGSIASDPSVPAGANPVARGRSSSAYSIARNARAVNRAQPPKGHIERVRSYPPTARRRAGAPHSCGSTFAPARGSGAALVREDELGLRSGTYSPTAVRASRPLHPLHASTAGEVASGKHRYVDDASRPGSTEAVMSQVVNDHE